MNILQGFIGFMLLTTGSQLYWLFSGVVAFLVGSFAATRFGMETGTDLILVGLGSAAVGILLTFTVRKPALILTGFLAGALAAVVLPEMFNWEPDLNEWLLLGIAGLLAGLLTYYSYAVAAILLSATTGAQMMALNVHFGGVNPQVMYLAFLVLGIGVQLILAKYAPPSMEN